MRKLAIIICLFIFVVAFSGCSKGQKMHQSKIKNEQGLPKLVHQIDEHARGKAIMDITEDIQYPGMLQYQDAEYDFTSGDAPETVVNWFTANLNGATMKKYQGQQEKDSQWIVKYKKFIIDVFYYSGSGTLIRYKYDIEE